MKRIWNLMTTILLSVGTACASASSSTQPSSTQPSSTQPSSAQPSSAQPSTAPGVLHVAIYDDGGGSHIGPENVEKCLGMAPEFQFKRITAQDIRGGVLKEIDVLVQPGGSGSKQAAALGTEGCAAIKQFVNDGGGYVGICAGAYLATTEYSWSLHILNAKVVDRAHWARGKGYIKLRWTPAGQQLLGTHEEISDCDYNQGPLLAPDTKAEPAAYQELATFDTEIAEKGAPAGVMKGTTAIACGAFGKGRVLCISSHPERSPGLDGVIRNAVQWVGKR